MVLGFGLLLSAFALLHNEKISFNSLQKIRDSKGVSTYLLDGKPFTGSTYDEYSAIQIYRELTFKDGLLQKENGWYSNGEKEREFFYLNGVLHGKAIIYHRSGSIYLEENYRNGVTEGKQFRYNCDGSLRAEWDAYGGIILMRLEYGKKKCAPGCKVDEGC